jgi:NAD(P)-dependent dehydrogenase (short-subunit alcohol dehydrogenase family)
MHRLRRFDEKERGMRRDLAGRVVLVTGASRGIGRRAAERLGREGVRLALTSRSGGELE